MIALIVIEMIFSYTRLTLALALGAGSVMVIGAFPRRRIRAGVASALVSVLILGVASPLLVARFEEPVVWPQPTPAPGASASFGPAPTPAPTPRLVLIDNSSKLRIDTHRRGLGYIVASPIVGHGTGSFDRLYEADTGRVGVAAHDDFLLFAVEDGLPGLLIVVVAYSALVGAGLLRLRRGIGDGFEAGAVVAFATLNLAAAIHNPTYFPELEVAAWAAVGLCWPVSRATLLAAYVTAQVRLGARRRAVAR
jgi:O-antigen ligase